MSKENLIQFMNQVTDSEELQNRIGDEIDTDALIALGAAHGCKFTAEDLTEYAELSDEELDSVAGGAIYVKIPLAMPRHAHKFIHVKNYTSTTLDGKGTDVQEDDALM